MVSQDVQKAPVRDKSETEQDKQSTALSLADQSLSPEANSLKFRLELKGEPSKLNPTEQELIDAVCKTRGFTVNGAKLGEAILKLRQSSLGADLVSQENLEILLDIAKTHRVMRNSVMVMNLASLQGIEPVIFDRLVPEILTGLNLGLPLHHLWGEVERAMPRNSQPLRQKDSGWKVDNDHSLVCDADLKVLAGSLRAVLETGQELVLRGGSVEEALGWLEAGPSGDPRVKSTDSAYTRRTGEDPPVFSVDDAGRVDRLDIILEAASTYARHGHVAEILQEAFGRPPTKDEIADALDSFTATQRRESFGALVIFSDGKGRFPPSFHRKDPRWNLTGKQTEYAFTSVMPPNTRRVRALFPVAPRGVLPPKGSFALIVSPKFTNLPKEVQEEVLQAFRAQDREACERLLG